MKDFEPVKIQKLKELNVLNRYKEWPAIFILAHESCQSNVVSHRT